MYTDSVPVSLLLLLLHLLVPVDLEEVQVQLEVITDSSPCSATCGLGLKTQTLCLLSDSNTAMEEQGTSQPNVSKVCRGRKVQCVDSWQCGLRTRTVTSGQKVDIDCLEQVMKALGKFPWRVSWRYARGIITSDDSFFKRWQAPHLDRVVLDPVKEEDAGTYRCDVQDANYRRVKRVYWGLRVLPKGVINLDYESTLTQGGQTEDHQHHLTTGKLLLYAVGIAFIIAAFWFEVMSLNLYRTLFLRERPT